jgi:hypothetical protein
VVKKEDHFISLCAVFFILLLRPLLLPNILLSSLFSDALWLCSALRAEVHKPCTAHSVRWCVLLCRARVQGMERPGPACSWWGEGRIGNWRGRRTDSGWERQMICLLRYGGGCRFDTFSSHTCTVHCTRAGILCTSALERDKERQTNSYTHTKP